MSSVAIFVDAGYLFAQGSACITGSKKARSLIQLNETAAVAALSSLASLKANNSPLLRIYWYDGARGSSMTLDHATLAHTDFVKLRLGFLNSRGQQKGVDSLIVTDLIELSRNKAITDALLMSGDEDVRIGVQIAQSFGVRVHLLGIAPSRGSQSPQLMQEADTTTEWDATAVGRFITIHPPAHPQSPPASYPPSGNGADPLQEGEDEELNGASFEVVAKELLDSLDTTDLQGVALFRQSSRGLPREIDGRLLARARVAIRRDLGTAEKREIRRIFCRLLDENFVASQVSPPPANI